MTGESAQRAALGAGSIVMKQGLIIFDKHIKEMKLNAAFVCNVHDEWQLEVAETDAIR